MTIFLTTQYMEETDQLCQRLAINDKGKIVAEGSPVELKASIGEDLITILFSKDEPFEKNRTRALQIAQTIMVKKAAIFDEGVSVQAANSGGNRGF
jgi:ABC-2 type transport system ATP-binding protein